MIQAKIVVFPRENGFNVLIWGKWAEGPMRARCFDNRISMIALLETLHLITPHEAKELETFEFIDSCPLYSAEAYEDALEAHGFSSCITA